MKRKVSKCSYKMLLVFMLCFMGTASLAISAELSVVRQREIIENYMYLTGQWPRPEHGPLSAGAEEINGPNRCGTPIVQDFFRSFGTFDPGLIRSLGNRQASQVTQATRPNLSSFLDTPSGLLRIHYTTTGSDAAANATVDGNGNGIPDYVETVAIIADSVYDFTVNRLGYVVPEPDGNCPDGIDNKVDIYLVNLPPGFFGLTQADTSSACGQPIRPYGAVSWVLIDNDFSSLLGYKDRPLDAARVTLAHEFFHVIHFTLDFTESPVLQEMTATWMEEEQYDNLNDYYSLLPRFFNFPRRSLQSTTALHNNASVVWAIYLVEKYGPNIIRNVWNRSADLGNGGLAGNYLQAFAGAIDSASGSTESLTTDMSEFAVWNYFTGPSASQAPNGIGYSEAANYPAIPIDSMDRWEQFHDTVVTENNNLHNPEINASTYVRFENVQFTLPVGLPFDPFFSLNSVDTLPAQFGVAEIRQLAAVPDSHEVFMSVQPSAQGYSPPPIANPSLYRSITYIFTAASADGSFFPPSFGSKVPRIGYAITDSNKVMQVIDSQFVNVPAAVLTPYPNPAVLSQMGGDPITFRFQVPTTSLARYQFTELDLKIDLFTIAGEHVSALGRPISIIQNERNGLQADEVIYTTQWNMKNQSGRDVTSGVYIAYARLLSRGFGGTILAEDKVKVAVIR